MNTKPIPALTMLIAGILTCVVGYLQHYELYELLKLLVLVLVCFYLIGSVAKFVLDCVLNNTNKEALSPEENQDETQNSKDEPQNSNDSNTKQ